ncbi:amidohydrolase family protein [Desulfotalea psychrophila]|uniref:Adenosine deaminase domain-containing protein n=1 Tax=Desulfotalea psychrophila (strain LSv54 / DSM 12343) TaxID=177439 RepID=Q6AL84_DESPS|nr:hypothetical protein [Desulfotalea psychrophila]CAG36891.1 unknown protein [Desulfotalea psychrophila LSv54]
MVFLLLLDDHRLAWKLRQYCPLKMQRFQVDNPQKAGTSLGHYSDMSELDEYIREALPPKELRCAEDGHNREAHKINNDYQHRQDVRERGSEKIFKKYEATGKLDKYETICDDDLLLLELIQDSLIQKICDKEIIIETNPTSNVYISFLGDHAEHPIFRWHPINREDLNTGARFNPHGLRTSKAKVCINTDDPAIFVTSLPNEYDLLKNAALSKHSHNQEEVEVWLEGIRKTGLDIFDYDHLEHEYSKIQ